MDIFLGIDVGISTAKLALTDGADKILASLQLKSPDSPPALHRAAQELLRTSGIAPGQLTGIAATGVGAGLAGRELMGIPVQAVDELTAVGRGGLLLSGLSKALVMSVGTGTAFVYVSGSLCRHLGGSGVGGGTLLGLASRLLGVDNVDELAALAAVGDLSRVDLTVGDVSGVDIGMLSSDVTAANFGKNHLAASRADVALGLLNLVFQTVGVMATFACAGAGVKTVAAVGSPTELPQARPLLHQVGSLFGIDFIIPDHARYAAAVGAVNCTLD